MSILDRCRARSWWQAPRAVFATVALLGSLMGANAHAADGIFIGVIPSQFSLPSPIWLPGATPGSGHLWIADNVLTFCRLDAAPNLPSGTVLSNAATCDGTARAPSQAVWDPRANPDGTHYIYIADDSTQSPGAVRVTFNPKTETIIRGSGIVLGDGVTVGRTNSIAFNTADGKLYLGHIRSGSIFRIANPDQDPSQQLTEIVGRTSDGRGIRGGMTFVCGTKASTCDLYIGEVGGNGVTIIPDAQTCNPFGFGGCLAAPTSITTNFPGGLTSDGNQTVYVGDSPRTNTGTILRYNVYTNTQDVVSSRVPGYQATFPAPQIQATYTGITGIAFDSSGNLFVGDDPTLGAVAPPRLQGKVWKIGGVQQSTAQCSPGGVPPVTTACLDALGGTGVPAQITPPPSLARSANLVSYGQTSPHGMTWIPGALGGHLWVSDHTQGLCRMDPALQPGLFATNPLDCDKGGVIGSPGQPVFDPAGNFIYVPDQAVKSPGLWRLNFDPASETISNPTLMAPGAGLDNDKLDGVAMGPDGNLYAGGLKNGFIYRIQDPHGDPAAMQVSIIGTTTDNRGINGSIGFLGNDLYLPENRGGGVIANATGCATQQAPGPCASALLPIPSVIFASSVATDQKNAMVYVAVASGSANGTIYRYDPRTATSVIYATRAQLPPGITAPGYLEDCTQTCQRLADAGVPADGLVGFHFPLGMYVDGSGNLLIGDDPVAGVRGFHGHVFSVPYTP